MRHKRIYVRTRRLAGGDRSAYAKCTCGWVQVWPKTQEQAAAAFRAHAKAAADEATHTLAGYGDDDGPVTKVRTIPRRSATGTPGWVVVRTPGGRELQVPPEALTRRARRAA